MQANKLPVPPIFFMAIGVIAISFSAILIKWSSAPAAVLGLYRILFTLVLLAPFLLTKSARAEIRTLQRRTWALVALSGLFLGLHFILWIGSLKYTTVASSTILITLQPIFVMVIAYFALHERSRWLSLAGTLVVAAYLVIGQHLRGAMSSMVYSLLVYIFSILTMFFYCLWEGYPLGGYPAREWLLFVLLAVIPTVFGHTLFNWLLKYVNAATISMAILFEPIGATILAFLLLGEAVSSAQWLGGAVILGGIWLFLSGSRQAAD